MAPKESEPAAAGINDAPARLALKRTGVDIIRSDWTESQLRLTKRSCGLLQCQSSSLRFCCCFALP